MSNLLCDICNTIFKEPKPEQSRSSGGVVFISHFECSEQLQSGIKTGCAVCTAISRRMASKSAGLETPSSFHSSCLIYDIGHPGQFSFLLSLTIDGKAELDRLNFGRRALGSDFKIQRLCQPKSPGFKSDSTIQLMQGWLETCLDRHQKCTQRGKDSEQFQLPTRLLDIGVLGSRGCRLVLTDSESISERYLTLSHSWGSSPFLQLNSETMSSLTAGIPIHELPATFQDAIFIAQQLGIRYMWIDSLCIQQDSKEDWIREAPTMRQVYGFATVNIVAGHSEGPEGGLFSSRDLSSVESLIVESKWDDQPEGNYLLWDELALQQDFESAPLTQRGWVFQERLLAPRILQFGKIQVYWRCSELFGTEAWPQGVRLATGEPLRFGTDLDALDKTACMEIPPISKWHQGSVNLLSQEPVAVWERLVVQYSKTELTYGEDKLVALSGVAKLFQQTFKDRYIAGMWWSTFPRLLCWRRGWEKEATVRPDYRAPSWSWASIDGPIHFTARIPAMFYTLLLEEYLVEVVDASVVPVGNDEMAQVQGGRMTVKARLHSLKVISQQEKRVTFEIDGKGQECGEGTFILDATLQEEEELQDQQLWIMPTMLVVDGMEEELSSSAEGILLRRKTEIDGGTGADDIYERIGYFLGLDVEGDRGDERFGLHVEKVDGNSETGSTLRLRRDTDLLQTVTIV